MQAKNVWSYIKVGTGFRYLQEATRGRAIHGDNFVLGNIERFLLSLDELELRVTSRAADKLRALRERLSQKGELAELSKSEADELKGIIKEIRGTFSAEAKGIYTYIVTEKRLSTEKLLSHMEDLFAPKVFEQLTNVAQYDFKEAGRCIAFERATAAAFHLMRGIESILRQYFKEMAQAAKNELSWGEMVYEVKKARDPRTDRNTLKHLDHIRSAFRNPTQHPDKIYDVQEAQDLFFLAIDVTNRMVSEMNSDLTNQADPRSHQEKPVLQNPEKA
ncbi:MAG: hypothetical protein ACE5F7_06115 [Nitrospiria bacterium]